MAQRRGGPTHRPSVWAGAIAISILLIITAVRYFGDYLYHYPENPSLASLPDDAAIVCLAGGKFRVEAAYSLYSQGVGNRLLIIGAGKRSTPLGLARAHANEAYMKISPERFKKIEVETESKNTLENAFAVQKFLQENRDVKSVILITSGYHMRRSQMMIEHQIPPGVKIIPYIPESESIQKQNWWHSWLGIQVTMLESIKLVLASLLVPNLSYF